MSASTTIQYSTVSGTADDDGTTKQSSHSLLHGTNRTLSTTDLGKVRAAIAANHSLTLISLSHSVLSSLLLCVVCATKRLRESHGSIFLLMRTSDINQHIQLYAHTYYIVYSSCSVHIVRFFQNLKTLCY